MRLHTNTLLLVLVGCVPGFLAGCVPGRSGSPAPDRDGFIADGFIADGFTADGAPVCTYMCSSDLHSVLCNGNVVMQCPPAQGCSPDGTCVAACDAARLNKSTIGCDFYSVAPATILPGSCFAVTIANTWTSPITIQADYGSQTFDAATHTFIPTGQGTTLTYQPLPGGQLPPGKVGILFLSEYESGAPYHIACPQPAVLNMDTSIASSGIGSAFHITTNAPVVAYDTYPWGGAQSYVSSATLLLPTPTWGTNFVAADAWNAGPGQPFTQVVAAEDATTVTMVPIAAVQAGAGSPSGAAHTPMTFMVNRGQVVQFLQLERLTGSVIKSDKPISVWGGASCMNIPDGRGACDGAHQQELPVQIRGSEYIGARYPSRGGDDNAPYMLVGMVDGTTLTYDPAPPVGAPTTLSVGQAVTFFTGEAPFAVRSQDVSHPFSMYAYMTGGELNPTNTGDPEFVNVVAPQQFLDSYLFVTDPTYANTALVFVRKKAADGTFKDVTLDCAGVLTGWVPVGTGGQYEMARPMIVSGFQPNGTCMNGAHTASSAEPFGLTVWGYDFYASYGYPAGMSVRPINTVVVTTVN